MSTGIVGMPFAAMRRESSSSSRCCMSSLGVATLSRVPPSNL
eukprot:CAMPEP_0177372070 /NCGR_PEP_ID=MMETSP0368-20130122/42857_1 /TAXON_ID=447022 ORGANISM="Scrippsiella hangoei-like, Strain SHHI-4" /NCGR_SAMPLE_ID=MMETSP0368 /ASSEMBLY_ACC=CAM_ASM_000363 /LENGTH=41 /DNA_ID= /DNA_START= /DNA_END= /DNA_ORIENTATION=